MNGSVFEQTRPVDYLLRLAASDIGRTYKGMAQQDLDIRTGDVVLDLGCGPGADLSSFAAAVGASGRVIGVDSDHGHVAYAAAATADRPQVEVRVGDIHRLDLPDDSVDRVHTDRVLQHVEDPAAVLGEAHRVIKPGGRAVFAEPDWDTLVIDHPDVSLARAYTRFVADKVVRNGCIGRQLAGLAMRAGLSVEKVVPITTTFDDVASADQVFGLRRVTDRAVIAGYLSADGAEQWLASLASAPFFAAATLFIVVAAKSHS
jgi:ubiquinone/menaquinone biosynthesis C-methylase UbiE